MPGKVQGTGLDRPLRPNGGRSPKIGSMSLSAPLVLGIESSCDETGVGIVRGTELLVNAVASSMEEHVRFGGVIPEIASRAHLDARPRRSAAHRRHLQ